MRILFPFWVVGSSAILPKQILAFVPSHGSRFQIMSSRHLSSTAASSDNELGDSSTAWIDTANDALEKSDLEAAENALMMAVAEVNGAVMNHPKLLSGFEALFRTKIERALSEDTSNAKIAQDRMGLASLLTDQSKYQEAADELELAVESLAVLLDESPSDSLSSAFDKASSLLFRTRAMICDWRDYDRSGTNLAKSTIQALEHQQLPAVHPFEALTWPSISLKDATSVAHAYGMRAIATAQDETNGSGAALPWKRLEERLPRTRVPFVRAITTTPLSLETGIIRVGYLSPDFTGKHPLAFLMQDVFRFHDSSRFEILLYSLGGDPDSSPEVQKILTNDDSTTRTWRTLRGSLSEMAETIRTDELDVLVDLCGYTGTSLVAEVLAYLKLTTRDPTRSSPIHVAYMGYPGSSGAPFIDYMIADATVIPSVCRKWYTENILFMPHCYFVNSHKHILPPADNDQKGIRRQEYGLPPEPAFVFCCHSRPDKIDPKTFATWIRAVQKTRTMGQEIGRPDMANAVLWLLNEKESQMMKTNLRAFAKTIVEDPDAFLRFCEHAPRQEHLRRLSLADLFLDTPSYNAHTVGCDCLSAGVPMLSLVREWHPDAEIQDYTTVVPTEKLASRVGSSLLKSALSSSTLVNRLVVSSMKEYEDRMVECALDPQSTTRLWSSQLLEERERAPLWDTERWVRNLETGFTAMVDTKRNSNRTSDADIYVMDYI